MKKLPNIEKKIKRQEQKDAGVFDGRFKQRVVKNKKKEEVKYLGRNKVEIDK